MCEKQCRDENGFKCHITSESHQRQLLLFADNSKRYLDQFSHDFKKDFIDLLSRRFGTKRVHANVVYQEYIGFKEHIHMNSTRWHTLTGFVKWLGKQSICVVDETEKGWFIQWIDRNWETIQKQEAVNKKEKMDLDDEERIARFVKKQIERVGAPSSTANGAEATELKREDEEQKVAFSLEAKTVEKPSSTTLPASALAVEVTKKPKLDGKATMAGQKRKMTALDEIMELEEKKKETMNRKDHWLHTGIVVKVMTKKLGDSFYKKKAVVRDVINDFTAVVKLVDSGEKLKIDQAHLETVIPACGKKVLVVNGAYRGKTAVLLELNERKFSCSVKIDSGPLHGRVVDGVQYEDICKLHEQC